jgi:hypothetical protein
VIIGDFVFPDNHLAFGEWLLNIHLDWIFADNHFALGE